MIVVDHLKYQEHFIVTIKFCHELVGKPCTLDIEVILLTSNKTTFTLRGHTLGH